MKCVGFASLVKRKGIYFRFSFLFVLSCSVFEMKFIYKCHLAIIGLLVQDWKFIYDRENRNKSNSVLSVCFFWRTIYNLIIRLKIILRFYHYLKAFNTFLTTFCRKHRFTRIRYLKWNKIVFNQEDLRCSIKTFNDTFFLQINLMKI